ncbi:MAG: valine--tRNA ligase [Patescibacteria group bacterium]|nr:valine--tRNA ligase [Patescibacteria group bacterium]
MNDANRGGQGPRPDIPEKYLKPFDPASVEARLYEAWEKSGYFDPDTLPDEPGRGRNGQPFSMVLPPPNVTGVLHMGSALMLAVEDIMARYARMKGRKALWIPGTDHAAIATQAVVEKKIQKEEGKSRHDLGRDELMRRIGEHVTATHDAIVSQMRTMGASLDWSREAFTLDDKRDLAVRTAFKRMYDDGLIYRGYRVVNWDPKGQTTISDDEIEYEARTTKLYTFRYSKDIPISISTTRPETKLGDTAIAVNPDDERYKAFVGAEFKAVFAGEPISLKVVADRAVEKEFGTGALGVTPAHSVIDWEMSQRHGLPLKQVINEYGKMTVGMDGVKDKKTAEAREAVVAWLRAEGLLEKEEDIEHNISLAQRTGGVIEPLPKLQWFVAVNKAFKKQGERTEEKGGTTLKGLMKEAVSSGATKIIPDRFEKVYFNWIENLRDWCISRQIWYGHRIPVWYKGDEAFCGLEAPEGDGWVQDEDTLDTWFSSGLWTFSTLGWPDEKEFAKNRAYHPTTVLETGSDLIFFWVARMILMSTYLLGEVPFRTVYFHGLVRDTKNRKISKSLGNNIDPVDMIARYGADAVRMSLVVGVGPGNDSKIDEAKIKAYKLFSNKLWNIARFVFSTADMKAEGPLSAADQAVMDGFRSLLAEITVEMDEYKYYLVAEKLYAYAWRELADKVLEESKPILAGPDAEARRSRSVLLRSVMEGLLKALHPFMPFITEEIWKDMPVPGKKPLIVEKWAI